MAFRRLVFLGLSVASFLIASFSAKASDPEPDFDSALETLAIRDTLVDVHCPKCDDFESRRLEVLKSETGALTALRFFKMKSGAVTDTLGPDQLKEGLVPMYEQSGFTVLQLDARLVNPEKGGKAVLVWYGNVLTRGGKDSLEMLVDQDSTGDWGLSVNGRRVTELLVTPSSFGIDEVVSR